jgi:CheY-like chemotaxis protein
MSLEGKLEELGLGEILQIVSLSRKTGILSLSSKGMDGSVFFRQGLVVKAYSSAYQHSLGDVLLKSGVIDLTMLRKSLAFQQENGFSERLGEILVKNFGISQEIIADVVREQIEHIVFSLFDWSTGTFKFVVQNSIDTVENTKMDPLQYMLDQGLNPQFLAMEGTRILDEKRQTAENKFTGEDSTEDAVDFAFDLADVSNTRVASLNVIQQPIVIVDDDGPSLRVIAEKLAENGYVVHSMTRSEDTLIKVDSLHRGGEYPIVLIDLIMPKMDGSGVLGGVELLDLLHNNFKELPMIVMTDYHHAEAENKIRELGYPFIIKPRRVEINTPDIIECFISQILHIIRPASNGTSSEKVQDRFNLGDALRSEMGEDDDMPCAVEFTQQDSGLSLLRGMLEELNNPDLQGGVLLLVLRFASEFVNRAIIFTLNDHIISGFGQFGIIDGTNSGDERVRSIHLQQESGSMFTEPLRTGQPMTFPPNPTPVDLHLFEQLGGGIPAEIFIGPLISKSRIIGFLYGDNLPETKEIGDVAPLTIFLAQAGVSMEKALLERQLNERVTQ